MRTICAATSPEKCTVRGIFFNLITGKWDRLPPCCMFVRCHLSALTGLIWTDVGQARLPDVRERLIYVIESTEPSSLPRSKTTSASSWQIIPEKHLAKYSPYILHMNPLPTYGTPWYNMDLNRRVHEDNQHRISRKSSVSIERKPLANPSNSGHVPLCCRWNYWETLRRQRSLREVARSGVHRDWFGCQASECN